MRTIPAFLLLVLVVAGCAGSAGTRPPERRLPRALARGWATQAATIAAAAAGGNSCRARRLANSLQTEVISAGGRVPERLWSPLLGAVSSLAGRITCTPPQEVTPAQAEGPPKPGPKPEPPGPKPKPPKSHGPPGHGHEHGGDG